MEKVWQELKKIEAQAEQIRNEAQEKSRQIVDIAQQEAEKLVLNSKTYAQEEAQKLEAQAIQDAQRDREQKLEVSRQTAEEIRRQAVPRMDKASDSVVSAVLGEKRRDEDNKVR